MSIKFQHLKCQDHTVSKEFFVLEYEEQLMAYRTVPEPKNLASYYESEDYISHTDLKKSLMDRLYRQVRKIALKKKLKLINLLSEDKTLLDVGCGTGDFIKTCANAGWHCIGVEPNVRARELAIHKSNRKVLANIELIDEQFDIITLWHVLEHISDPSDYLNKLKSLLKPNGKIIIAIPNYNSFDAQHYNEHWAAFDVPRHLWHFSQTSIQKLARSMGMKVLNTEGMKFDAYYVSLLSEKYKKGRPNYLKSFWIGFKSNWLARKSSEYSSLIYTLKKEN